MTENSLKLIEKLQQCSDIKMKLIVRSIMGLSQLKTGRVACGRTSCRQVVIFRREARQAGKCIEPSKYVRLEHFLRTIPSPLRHASICRVDSGKAPGTMKRPLAAQLIRHDVFLSPLIEQCKKDDLTKEHPGRGFGLLT
jgi:hypothetical protein